MSGAQKNSLIKKVLLRNKKNNFRVRTLIWGPATFHLIVSSYICYKKIICNICHTSSHIPPPLLQNPWLCVQLLVLHAIENWPLTIEIDDMPCILIKNMIMMMMTVCVTYSKLYSFFWKTV